MKPINHESEEPIWLITKASDTGVGVWVGLGPTSEIARPVVLHSWRFLNVQINYGTTDKEALVIVNVLETYHYILAWSEFTTVTDHQPLTHLKTTHQPTQRQLRWKMLIAKFRAKIEYRPGKWNYLADALSCLYDGPDNHPVYLKDPTDTEHLSADQSSIYAFTSEELLPTMSDFEPITTINEQPELDIVAHSDCGSKCSQLNPR